MVVIGRVGDVAAAFAVVIGHGAARRPAHGTDVGEGGSGRPARFSSGLSGNFAPALERLIMIKLEKGARNAPFVVGPCFQVAQN